MARGPRDKLTPMAEPAPKDEPRRHPLYFTLLALVALGTVPLPFLGRETVFLLGLPAWLWWSFGMTAAFAGLTSWGILRYWHTDDEA